MHETFRTARLAARKSSNRVFYAQTFAYVTVVRECKKRFANFEERLFLLGCH